MKLVQQNAELILLAAPYFLESCVEMCARTCYKSLDKATDTSYADMIRRLVANKHEAMLEHAGFSARITTSRAIANELVRHRMASFAQESTRYVNYKDGVSFVEPVWYKDEDKADKAKVFKRTCEYAEKAYKELVKLGATAQQARDVLTLATATEIVVTANFREWRHILTLRCAKDAHPDMRQLALLLLKNVHSLFPEVFEDLFKVYEAEIVEKNIGDISYIVPEPSPASAVEQEVQA